MLTRVKTIVFSLAAVLGVFGLYRLTVVPWVEPRVPVHGSGGAAPTGDEGETAERLRAAQLEQLFPPGAWELDQPKVLETDRGMLLLKDYEPQEGGRLSLTRCTLIFCPAAESTGTAARKRPVVLRAPQGAVLQFDRDINLSRGEIGQLLGGRLDGPITIVSPESAPGANDALQVKTQDVQIEKDRIVAPQAIEFRYGPNSGRGRDLTITFKPSPVKPETADKNQRFDIGEPQNLKLVHVEQVVLRVQASGDWKRSAAGSKTEEHAEQLEISCRGPFQYDFLRQEAMFEDHVQVRHHSPQAAPDQLDCQWLTAHFRGPEAADEEDNASPRKSREIPKLEVESVRARGSPAVLTAPSYAASARGEVLEYNFRTRRVHVEDKQKLLLRYQRHEFEANWVEYQFAQDARLGQLHVRGPGVLRGALADDSVKTYEVTWQKQLLIRPDRGYHALSLISHARVRVHGMADCTADDIHVWLREVPTPAAKDGSQRYEYLPDRILAERDVRVDSWQLAAATQKAEIWIRYEDAAGAGTNAGQSTPVGGARGGNAAKQGPLPDATDPRSQQKADVAGDLVQMQLLRQRTETVVEHLILGGSVHFRESGMARPGELPLSILGDVVQVDHANTPAAQVRVQGKPAKVSARGVTLMGEKLQLHRGDNRAWVAGPGTMTLSAFDRLLPVEAGPAHVATAATPPTTIVWQGGMEFDGQRAQFQRDVRVMTRQQNRSGEVFDLQIHGPELDVTLTNRLDFSQDQQTSRTEVQKLTFRGAVALQNRGSRQGMPTSVDQMHVRDLTVEQTSGRMHAVGPGWGTSVRHGMDPRGPDQPAPGPAPGGRPPELIFVRVDFDDELVGNVHDREVEFRGRVKTVYGPVTAWDQTLNHEPLDGLRRGEFLLTSQRLAVVDMGPSTESEGAAIELSATGNAAIEGADFTARGNRISYARAKELVILEGDGRTDAELWRKGSTTPDAAAQQIRFWPRDSRYQVDGARFLNLR
jgi:hypothetical protein